MNPIRHAYGNACFWLAMKWADVDWFMEGRCFKAFLWLVGQAAANTPREDW